MLTFQETGHHKTYTMLEHHLQRTIVYKLAFEPSLRFSDLKPDVIESKLFTYHLKKVVAAGYVIKKSDGSYALTPEGRRLGVKVLDNQQELLVDRADSVLFLVIRRKTDSAWLLYRRNTYPLIDRVGFMHCAPSSQTESVTTAQQALQDKTGISGIFVALGGGYFRVYEQNNLESFTHFTLLVCEDAHGVLNQTDSLADYFWTEEPDFTTPEMLPNMSILAELYKANKPFYIEERLDV